MNRFFQNLNMKMQRRMAGRYGGDELSHAINIVVLIGLILSCIPALRVLYIPTFALLIWSTVRIYSRNIEKRRAERSAYLRFMGKIKNRFSLNKRMWRERKTHKYIRCRQCKAVLRVPRGKGRIRVTCSSCHSELMTKT